MASNNVGSINNRVQHSADPVLKGTGNSFFVASLPRPSGDQQGALYGLKTSSMDVMRNDVPSATGNNSLPNPALVPSTNSDVAPKEQQQFGHIVLDISNSVLPLDKLAATPSSNDGLSEDLEHQIRSLGCESIQLAGKLLKLPQVAMATGCVLFQRFFYAKSLVRYPFDHVAMACIGLASKIEESPRRTRDIINVFHHIKQVRSGRTIQPMVLDQNYISLKNQIIKAERRVLKELGFCVHVKHPHKIIVMYLRWLEASKNMELQQMSWNFMNDCLRTDVFVRCCPETIATACIYLSARKLKVPLPKNPSWFDVLGVEEDDIKDCCYRIMCLYDRKKPNYDDLERKVEELRRKMEESKKLRSAATSTIHTPSNSSPASRTGSPTSGAHERDRDHREGKESKLGNRETREGHQMNANSFGGERRSGSNHRHTSHQDINRKSYQNRFQSMTANVGNGAGVGGAIIGAGVNDENTNDRNSLDAGRNHDGRRGIDRDNRNRDYHSKANEIEGDLDSNEDNARKLKKHKRSRSHSGGDDRQNRRDRKKGKHKRKDGVESPEGYSPSKKGKRHHREKSRYDEREHHPDYYDRRLGRDQLERGLNQPNVINSKSDDTARGGSFPASDNTYFAEDNRRDRSGSGYGSSSDQRNSLSYKNRDRGRDFYRR